MGNESTVRVGRRVVQVLDGAGWAGTERHVRGLIRELPALGWTLDLITSRSGPLQDYARELGHGVHQIERPSSRAYLRTLTQLLRRLRPDLLHAHSGRLPCLGARRAGVRAIVETRHGLMRERNSPLYRRFPILRVIEGWKCRLSHRTITVCHADLEWLSRNARLPERQIRVVCNGVPRPDPVPSREEVRRELGLDPGTPVFGFVGRLADQKEPGRLLDLLDVLGRRNRDNWICVICGSGPLETELQESARGRGLEDRIRWLGTRADAASLLAGFDLVCLPSNSEGLPYVLLEALAVGVPILATPVGGVPEVLGGPTLGRGCLPWNAEIWADRAEELVSSEGLRNDWRRASGERSMDFEESVTVRGVAEVYDELLGR